MKSLERKVSMKVSITILLLSFSVLTGCKMTDNEVSEITELKVGEVEYKVVFEAIWSKETHPSKAPHSFPSNPHFSPLIGAVHNSSKEYWDTGELASEGMKLMAETGKTSKLIEEINASIEAKTSKKIVKGVRIDSPSSTSVKFVANKVYSQLTLVTMLAPSPDWFTGIHGYNLLDESGNWIESKEIPVRVYDSGTDSGVDFGSKNSVTSPPVVISVLTEGSFSGIIPSGPLKGKERTFVGIYKLEKTAEYGK